MEFDFTKEPGRNLLDRGLNKENGKPLVSIITPFYNAEKYFEQTFNCVMNQTFPWFEWVIVDDGSTDEQSIKTLASFAAKDARIKVFRKENGGISTARNLGIKNARANIILPLDADDLIEPTYVETLYWALYYNPDYAWAYSNSVGFQGKQYVWNKTFDAERLKAENFLTNCAAIRKKDLEEVGCYDEITKHYYEDWRLWLKMLSAHMKPVKTSGFGFWYRRLDSGVLSVVNKVSETQKLTTQLIEEVAATVDTSIMAKTYPEDPQKSIFNPPIVSTWNRKVFARHEKIHVLMLLPWMVMGGADKFYLDVCTLLDKTKFELGIITTVQSDNPWQQKFAEHVTDIFNLPEFLSQENWVEFISYYIISREVDVLFLSNSFFGFYLVPWLRKEFPELAIVDYVHMEEWNWNAGGFARASAVMGDILERTFVCNEKTRQVMVQHFHRAPETVETLYIGVDTEKYDASNYAPGEAKKLLGIDEERPMILFPCRICPQKRPFFMLEIAKKLHEKRPDVAIAVVGEGPQLIELKKAVDKAKLENTVYFAGQQADMPPWYRDAVLTLICSIKEGLSLTAYESLSMGVPVVTSDVGGQAELVDKSVGYVLPLMQDEATEYTSRKYSQNEIEQYVDVILSILSDQYRYEKMCAESRRRIIQQFSLSIMISRLEEIITEIVNSNKYREKRKALSHALQLTGNYVDDSVNNFIRWQTYERLTFSERERATQVRKKLDQANRTLDNIYRMRTWNLIEQYRHFMDTTVFGRFLAGIRDLLRG